MHERLNISLASGRAGWLWCDHCFVDQSCPYLSCGIVSWAIPQELGTIIIIHINIILVLSAKRQYCFLLLPTGVSLLQGLAVHQS